MRNSTIPLASGITEFLNAGWIYLTYSARAEAYGRMEGQYSSSYKASYVQRTSIKSILIDMTMTKIRVVLITGVC